MSLTLRPEDRRAVDLLLDRSPAAANGNGRGHTVYAAADPAMTQRVAGAQKLLHLLEAMPEIEPSPDLITRTLRRVERAHAAPHHARPQLPSTIIDSPTVA